MCACVHVCVRVYEGYYNHKPCIEVKPLQTLQDSWRNITWSFYCAIVFHYIFANDYINALYSMFQRSEKNLIKIF